MPVKFQDPAELEAAMLIGEDPVTNAGRRTPHALHAPSVNSNTKISARSASDDAGLGECFASVVAVTQTQDYEQKPNPQNIKKKKTNRKGKRLRFFFLFLLPPFLFLFLLLLLP